MKKEYIAPSMKVKDIKTNRMLCASNLGYDSASGTQGNVTTGGNDSKDDWEDDEYSW